MSIFPTWNISYTGCFLPRSLPTRLLCPTFSYGYHSSLSTVRVQVPGRGKWAGSVPVPSPLSLQP